MADGDTFNQKTYLIPTGHSHTTASAEALVNVGAGMANNQVLCVSVVVAARAASNGNAFGFVGRLLVKKDNAGTVTGTLAGDNIDPNTLGWAVSWSSPQILLAAANGARSTIVLRGIRLEHA
jgi:hypothetical protein